MLIRKPLTELGFDILLRFARHLRDQPPAELLAQFLKFLLLIRIDERLHFSSKETPISQEPLDLTWSAQGGVLLQRLELLEFLFEDRDDLLALFPGGPG